MSYDVHVYSREQTPLDIGRLTERMRSLGWEIRVLDDTGSQPVVVADGPVPVDSMVFGWDRDIPQAGQLAPRFPVGGTVNVESFPEELQLASGGCGLYFHPVEDAKQWKPESWTPEEWQEFRKRVTPEQYTFLCDARAHYYLRTSAHVNPFRFLFQCDLGWAVAMETGGLVEDPQDWQYFWAREATPDPRTPMERAVEEYQTLFPESRWDGLRVELPDDDDEEEDVPRPDGVNTLILLALLEGGLNIFRLVLDLMHRQHFSSLWMLLAVFFLAIALGLFRGWRWAWWSMLAGYVLVVGADVVMLLSDGFGFRDGMRMVMIGIAVAYLLTRNVRKYFGM